MRALGSASVQPLPAEVGAELVVGAVRLHMLGPDRAYGGTRSDPNNSSVVMQATIAGHTVLLPGDVEVAAQQDLLSRGDDLRSDVLKVPHHGSAYFDDAFLRAVHPALGLISVGKNNDYGHPAPSLLSEMDRLAVPVWRTDQSGDIALVATGDRLEVLSHHSTRQ
jgi:competence protein ComEC